MAPTHPNVLDIRSLAAFRILLGVYFLYDIYSRLVNGKYDWAWYTSWPPERSFVADHDTPHQAPLHQLWFYRGSLHLQQLLFCVTTVLVLCFTIGFFCRIQMKVLLWIFIVAQQCRHTTGTDGSDLYTRLLLLWTIFLPVEQAWSFDCRMQKRTEPVAARVKGLACLGLTLQISLMYWGTIMHRIEAVNYEWKRCDWLPPRLDAVHYALSGSFGVRNHLINRIIQTNPVLSKSMTVMAIGGETLAPLGLLLAGNNRHWFALLLFQLHLGLLIAMNLPNWQVTGMLAQIIYVPTHFWDRWYGKMGIDDIKKTDGDSAKNRAAILTQRALRPTMISKGIQIFFFSHALYNMAANRGWIPKLDNGDIGEGLRISQNWQMFGTVAHEAHNVFVTGYFSDTNSSSIDILRYISDGTLQPQILGTQVILEDMTNRYPSPRFERAIFTWIRSSGSRGGSIKKFCATLCVLLNEQLLKPLGRVELRIQRVRINPPGNRKRFDGSSLRNNVYQAICS